MALTLRIENETRLPDGGPLVYRLSGRRGADIGRDPYLDWTLPDQTRFISGKHCEIRWQDDGYVLLDVSTNGTFLNGSDRRMDGPHRIAHGDRLMIGNYIILAEFDDEEGMRAPVRDIRGSETSDFWGGEGAAEPIDRASLVHRAERPVKADFLDWAIDVPAPTPAASPFAASGPFGAGPAPAPIPAPATPFGGGRGGMADPFADMGGGPSPSPFASPFDDVMPASSAVWVDSAPSGDWASPSPEPAPAAMPAAPTPAPQPSPVAAPAPVRPEPARPTPRPQFSEPAPAAPPAPAYGAGPSGAGTAEFLALLAASAGVPADMLAQRDADELADDLGAMMRIVVENMMALLAARSETKRVFRSSEHTMIGATDNNPLKFSPTPEDAMRLMLGPRMRSYLDGREALAEGFGDLANHQLRTFAAMQRALKMLVEDLDPATIEKSYEPEHGIGSLIGSRKGRLWDQFVTRWQAKTMRNEDGMVGLFMSYFAECYDRLGAQAKKK